MCVRFLSVLTFLYKYVFVILLSLKLFKHKVNITPANDPFINETCFVSLFICSKLFIYNIFGPIYINFNFSFPTNHNTYKVIIHKFYNDEKMKNTTKYILNIFYAAEII